MEFRDQLNRKLYFSKSPTRIISLVPSITELICDLGLGSQLVGVTKFCVHPGHIRKEVAVVGGTKQVNFEKIKSLQPDIILCNKEENTLEMIQELVQIAPVHLSDIFNLEDVFELIEMYQDVFQVQTMAQDLISTITNEYQKFTDWVDVKPSKKVAYFIWKDPWMVAANQTFIDAMLQLNHFENYFKSLDRYPEVVLNEVYYEVNLVLLSSEPYPFNIEHKNLLRKNFPNAQIVLADGEFFSWYGSRLQYAFKYFKTLHLDLKH